MPKPLSVTIITRDEAHNIARCLESVRWADEIVVVDSGSTDGTIEICRSFPCRLIQTEWRGFGPTKRFAVEQAAHDWILSVDADEVITDALARAIRALLDAPPQAAAYRITRRSYYLGNPIRFSGWQRDCPVRLFDRRRGNFGDEIVHESVHVEGKVASLEGGLLLHYPYPSLATHLAKMERYSHLAAVQLHERGRSSTISEALLRAGAKFAKMYVLRGGFLDGKAGFVLASNSAYGVFLKYLRLWELSRRSST